jgi:KDO2-lipid IV(A) lauroyltransferase
MMLKLRQLIEYAIFRSVVLAIHLTPVRLQRFFSWCMAVFVFHVLPRKMTRYRIARDNINLAFGDKYTDAEVDRIIFRMWQHLFRLVTEVIQFPRRLAGDKIHDALAYYNKEPAVCALTSGRPVILLSGHFGNWEMSIASFGIFGFKMAVVARALDNPYLDDWFRNFRESTGHGMIDKRGGSKHMNQLLSEGKHLALLADQDAGQRGIFVDFFGTPASTFKSIALMAMEHDAIIVVGYSIRLPDNSHKNWVKFEMGCAGAVDPRDAVSDDPVHEITQKFTAALEQAVARVPEQYFWVHRRWKTAAPEEHAKRVRSAGVSNDAAPIGAAGDQINQPAVADTDQLKKAS